MTLVLTLEHGPREQTQQEARLDSGELVIGRSASADWQIDDPDMYVSRAHCTVSAREDGYFVTDTSSSGLFIDDAVDPVGTGNTVRLRNGMRLRLGEYVIWTDVQAAARSVAQPAERTSGPRTAADLGGDDFFAMRTEEAPKQARPADLPQPFDSTTGGFSGMDRAKADRPRSVAFDDPFSLDPVATPASPPRPGPDPFGDFGTGPAPAAPASGGWDDFASPANTEAPARTGGDWSGFAPPSAPPPPPPSPAEGAWAEFAPPPQPVHEPVSRPPRAARQSHPPQPAPPARAPAASPGPASDDALRAAFLRGLGLDPSEPSRLDAVAEMEKFGREYRLMVEGLMQLLRKRAEEKGNARIAQTVVGASQVNPLKFLPTAEDALAMMLSERSPGFLSGEPAIADAVRDLAEHHVRAWRGVQAALRRMIDRFDPAVIEEELKSSSAVGTLLAGGRGAKLWELYCKRHRDISMTAESRFLGDVGADFRNAYEED